MKDVELDAIDLRLIRAGDDIQAARTSLNAAMARAERAARDALATNYFTEVSVAKRLGVDRMTVRKWVGKR